MRRSFSELTSANITPRLITSLCDKGILTLTIDNHKARGALTSSMLQMLLEITSSPSSLPPTTKVMMIKSSSAPLAFSSGHSLPSLSSPSIFAECTSAMLSLRTFPLPTIALVSGLATGAGLQLALSCDLVYCDAKSTFQTPGAKLGLFCSTPSVELLDNVKSKHAMEMLLTGETVGAKRAEDIGIVTRICDDVEVEGYRVAESICTRSSEALKFGKEGMERRRGIGELEEIYRDACGDMEVNMKMGDAKEGVNALLEKREPKWK